MTSGRWLLTKHLLKLLASVFDDNNKDSVLHGILQSSFLELDHMYRPNGGCGSLYQRDNDNSEDPTTFFYKGGKTSHFMVGVTILLWSCT